MTDLPSGTVTFLFTDIEGSAAVWKQDRNAMADDVARHLTLPDAAIAGHSGVHFKTVGDGVQAVFPTAPQPVAIPPPRQRDLLAEDWGELGPLTVRMALHLGDGIPDERGDYLAAPLNRLSRLLAVGHGGQILLSQFVQQLCQVPCLPEPICAVWASTSFVICSPQSASSSHFIPICPVGSRPFARWRRTGTTSRTN